MNDDELDSELVQYEQPEENIDVLINPECFNEKY